MSSESGLRRGEVIKFLRTERGVTQRELAEAAGYQGPNVGITMAKIEKGLIDPPASRLELIANRLGYDLEQFYQLVARATLGLTTEGPTEPSGQSSRAGTETPLDSDSAIPGISSEPQYGAWLRIVEETEFRLRENQSRLEDLRDALQWTESALLRPLLVQLALVEGLAQASDYARTAPFPELQLNPDEENTPLTDEERNELHRLAHAELMQDLMHDYPGLEERPQYVPPDHFISGAVNPCYLVGDPVRWHHHEVRRSLVGAIAQNAPDGVFPHDFGVGSVTGVLATVGAIATSLAQGCLSSVCGPIAGRDAHTVMFRGGLTAQGLVVEAGSLAVEGLIATPALIASGSQLTYRGRQLRRLGSGDSERSQVAKHALAETEATLAQLWDWCQKQSYLLRSATGVGAVRVARLKTDVTYGRNVGYDALTRRQRFSLSATLDLAAMAIVVATMPTTYVLRSDESSERELASLTAWNDEVIYSGANLIRRVE